MSLKHLPVPALEALLAFHLEAARRIEGQIRLAGGFLAATELREYASGPRKVSPENEVDRDEDAPSGAQNFLVQLTTGNAIVLVSSIGLVPLVSTRESPRSDRSRSPSPPSTPHRHRSSPSSPPSLPVRTDDWSRAARGGDLASPTPTPSQKRRRLHSDDADAEDRDGRLRHDHRLGGDIGITPGWPRGVVRVPTPTPTRRRVSDGFATMRRVSVWDKENAPPSRAVRVSVWN